MSAPELSVVVPTVHYENVSRVVRALLLQTASPRTYEVVVSDSREGRWEEAIRDLVRPDSGTPLSYSRVIYCREDCDAAWRSRQMNAGIRRSSGAIVVLLAGDFTPAESFVDVHREFHRRHLERCAVAIGPSRFVEHQTNGSLVRWLEESGRLFGSTFSEGNADGFFYAGNASLKREFGDQVGWFDDEFRYDAMDDFEFGVRLRKAEMISFHVPAAVAEHEHEHEVDLREQEFRVGLLGESATVFERKHSGPYDWENTCARSPFRLRADALLWGLRYVCGRQEQNLFRYYSCRRDAAFSEGWRRGRRIPGCASPPPAAATD